MTMLCRAVIKVMICYRSMTLLNNGISPYRYHPASDYNSSSLDDRSKKLGVYASQGVQIIHGVKRHMSGESRLPCFMSRRVKLGVGAFVGHGSVYWDSGKLERLWLKGTREIRAEYANRCSRADISLRGGLTLSSRDYLQLR